jgi:maltose-binding protein MalE
VSRFTHNVSAAIEFVRFVSTSPEAQKALATEFSRAPTREEIYTELADDPDYPMDLKTLTNLLYTVLKTAKHRPTIPEWTTISEEMQQQIFAAYTGDDNPKPEMEMLQKFLINTVQGR